MKNIIIEYIEKSDLKIIDKLEKEIFKFPWSFDIIFDTLFYSNVPQIKALYNGIIVGYLFWNVYGNPMLAKEAEILNIAVAEKFRKKGIASALIKHAESLMPSGVKYFFLELREDNLSALSLYKKLGFIKIGIRKNYYKDGMTAILMKKNIK